MRISLPLVQREQVNGLISPLMKLIAGPGLRSANRPWPRRHHRVANSNWMNLDLPPARVRRGDIRLLAQRNRYSVEPRRKKYLGGHLFLSFSIFFWGEIIFFQFLRFINYTDEEREEIWEKTIRERQEKEDVWARRRRNEYLINFRYIEVIRQIVFFWREISTLIGGVRTLLINKDFLPKN